MFTHRSTTLLIASILIAFAPIAPPAEADDDPWRLRVNGVWVDPSVDFEDADDGDVRFESEDDFGISVAVERMISRRFGIELGALYAESSFGYDVQVFETERFETDIDTELNILTAGLNFHLTPDRSTDFYIGPLFAYIDFDDSRIRHTFSNRSASLDVRGSDDFALGAQLGADIALGDGAWGLNLSARYIDSSLGLTMGDGPEAELDFAPLMLGAGFSFKF